MKTYTATSFLPAIAIALALLTTASRSIGGWFDDPCKCCSPGYPLEANPSWRHRYDDASGTFCAPCYAYRPTCWQEWPVWCGQCPPPAQTILPPVIDSPPLPPLRVTPAPPKTHSSVQPPSVSAPKPAPRNVEDLDIAPLPPDILHLDQSPERRAPQEK